MPPRNGDSLYPRDPAARTHVERWMDWQLSVIGAPMGALLQGLIRSTPETRDAAAIEAARRRAITAWEIVDDAVASQPYLGGNLLSLAEMVLGHAYLPLVQLRDRAPELAESARLVRALLRPAGVQERTSLCRSRDGEWRALDLCLGFVQTKDNGGGMSTSAKWIALSAITLIGGLYAGVARADDAAVIDDRQALMKAQSKDLGAIKAFTRG